MGWDTSCGFCPMFESTNHLLLHAAIICLGCVAKCLNTQTVPGNLREYWIWLKWNMPIANDIYIIGVSASNNVCHACALISYLVVWARESCRTCFRMVRSCFWRLQTQDSITKLSTQMMPVINRWTDGSRGTLPDEASMCVVDVSSVWPSFV